MNHSEIWSKFQRILNNLEEPHKADNSIEELLDLASWHPEQYKEILLLKWNPRFEGVIPVPTELRSKINELESLINQQQLIIGEVKGALSPYSKVKVFLFIQQFITSNFRLGILKGDPVLNMVFKEYMQKVQKHFIPTPPELSELSEKDLHRHSLKKHGVASMRFNQIDTDDSEINTFKSALEQGFKNYTSYKMLELDLRWRFFKAFSSEMTKRPTNVPVEFPIDILYINRVLEANPSIEAEDLALTWAHRSTLPLYKILQHQCGTFPNTRQSVRNDQRLRWTVFFECITDYLHFSSLQGAIMNPMEETYRSFSPYFSPSHFCTVLSIVEFKELIDKFQVIGDVETNELLQAIESKATKLASPIAFIGKDHLLFHHEWMRWTNWPSLISNLLPDDPKKPRGENFELEIKYQLEQFNLRPYYSVKPIVDGKTFNEIDFLIDMPTKLIAIECKHATSAANIQSLLEHHYFQFLMKSETQLSEFESTLQQSISWEFQEGKDHRFKLSAKSIELVAVSNRKADLPDNFEITRLSLGELNFYQCSHLHRAVEIWTKITGIENKEEVKSFLSLILTANSKKERFDLWLNESHKMMFD